MTTATSLPVLNPEVLAACSADNLDEVVDVGASTTGCTDVVVSMSSDGDVVVLRPVPERELAPAVAAVVVVFRRTDRAVEVDVGARCAVVVEVLLAEALPAVVVVLSRVVVPRSVVDVASASGLEVVDEDGTEAGGRLTTWAGAGAADPAARTTTRAAATAARCARRVATVPGGWGGSRLGLSRHRRGPARRCPPTSSMVGAAGPRRPTPGGAGTTTSSARRWSVAPGRRRRAGTGRRAHGWPGGSRCASRRRR